MRLVDHPCGDGPWNTEPVKVHDWADICGLVVVFGQFTARPDGDYFYTTYTRDGRRASGLGWCTRSPDRQLMFDGFVRLIRMWADRADEARELAKRHEVAA